MLKFLVEWSVYPAYGDPEGKFTVEVSNESEIEDKVVEEVQKFVPYIKKWDPRLRYKYRQIDNRTQ